MNPGENPVNYFQSQMALVYNNNDNMAATSFISGCNSLYLVKHEVTKMRDILART